MPDIRQRLLVHGLGLLLVGLLTGALIPLFKNPRMGLAAHLAGVFDGMLLLLFAALWERIELQRGERSAFLGLLFSMYSIWGANTLAAILGTSRATPMAGGGFEAPAWQETLVLVWLSAAALVLVAVVARLFVAARKSLA